MKYLKKISLTILSFFCFTTGFSIVKNYQIAVDKLIVDGSEPEFENLSPGDTLFFESGIRRLIIIRNVNGSPNLPIVMTNVEGLVTIDTDHHFGVSVQNCKHIKITGTGDPQIKYGFNIERVTNGCGVGIGYLSSDFEIDHLSIKNCKSAGIYAKTDPDCTFKSVRDSFVQKNTIIHDNYIENVGVEGMYIGSSKYPGQTIECNGKDTLLMPHVLEGVKIFNNAIVSSGWDGIQISSATKDCQIYNNTILYDSQEEQGAQMSGILIGGGTTGQCFNNFIANGKGNGIEIHGIGGIHVFNNLIINAGITYSPDDLTLFKHGIFVSDVSMIPDSSIYIQNNTIINPKSDGIRFSSVKSKNNLIASNVIINPGNFDFYENGNTRFKGIDAYVMIPNLDTDMQLRNNYFTREFSDAGINDNYFPLAGSPLIDAGYTGLPSIGFDFENQPRPVGSAPDIGAYEYQTPLGFEDVEPPSSSLRIYPNPVTDRVTISIPAAQLAAGTTISIYNSGGMIVYKYAHATAVNAEFELSVNVGSLPSGLYVCQVKSEHKTEAQKFAINRN